MHQFQNYLPSNNSFQYQNPYSQQMYPQQIPNPQMDRMAQLQSMQQALQPQQYQQCLFGRVVDDFNSITANDVPMNGVGAVFVKKDGSEIQVRNWTANGTIATSSYTPVVGVQEPTAEISYTTENKTLETLLERFDELSGKVDGLSNQLVDIVKTKPSRAKKEEE